MGFLRNVTNNVFGWVKKHRPNVEDNSLVLNALDGLTDNVLNNFEIQESLLSPNTDLNVSAEAQIRDVVVATVVFALNEVINNSEVGRASVTANRGLLSFQIGGDKGKYETFSISTEDGELDNIDNMKIDLLRAINDIASDCRLDSMDVSRSIETVRLQIPVGYGNSNLINNGLANEL